MLEPADIDKLNQLHAGALKAAIEAGYQLYLKNIQSKLLKSNKSIALDEINSYVAYVKNGNCNSLLYRILELDNIEYGFGYSVIQILIDDKKLYKIKNWRELIKQVLVDKDKKQKQLNQCLYDAIIKNDVKKVKSLMDDGANANNIDEQKCTPLALSINLLNNHCFDVMIAHPNFCLDFESVLFNAFEAALEMDNLNAMRKLLKFINEQYPNSREMIEGKLKQKVVSVNMIDLLKQNSYVWKIGNKQDTKLSELVSMDQFNQSEHKFNLKLDSLVGSGGFGSVFKGKWNDDDVAFKFFNSESSFYNESDKHKKLRAPRIIHYYMPNHYMFITAKSFEKIYFFVMEYADKGSLDSIIRNTNTAYTEKDVIDWLLNIASGLEYLHYLGYIHGDLKPLNVFVVSREGAKLGDFGSMQQIGDENKNLTTYAYLAPEMIYTSTRVASKFDIYALGLLTWELGARMPSWHAEKLWYSNSFPFSLFTAIKHNMRPDINKNRMPKLNPLIESCLDPDPNKRHEATEIIKIVKKI